jgi:pyruvate formate lyase activating enzyme
MENKIEGTVFKIKRFSLHDGPGIRTSIFLKGCPLNCIWCHSPEGLSPSITIWYNSNVCIACGQCVDSCPENALRLSTGNINSVIEINRDRCIVSGECVRICPTGAMQFTGYKTTTAEIIREVEKDLAYYCESGGGVTLTGGEPLYQPEFSAEILKECKKRNIHTAVETSLFCDKKALKMLVDLVDLFIIDMKLFDSGQHLHYTGKANDKIIANFKFLADYGKSIIVRIPLIGNITNTKKNLENIKDFVKNTGKNIPIEEIFFNPLTENNYIRLNIPFSIKYQ